MSQQPSRIDVVIPVYNEAKTIEAVLRKVQAEPLVARIILVNDGSTDGTETIAARIGREDHRLLCLDHRVNQGKGACLRTGFAYVQSPIVVVQDGDLEYNPASYSELVAPIIADVADAVYGSRFLGSNPRRGLYFWHSTFNKALTTFSNIATGLNLTDIETGAKAFRRDILEKITIEEDRFGFEPEITAKLARVGARIYEIGISYDGRTYEEGKKVAWRDGVDAFWCVLKYWMRRGKC
jgi:glycosyltransferase involved in cell wall biosynthesis